MDSLLKNNEGEKNDQPSEPSKEATEEATKNAPQYLAATAGRFAASTSGPEPRLTDFSFSEHGPLRGRHRSRMVFPGSSEVDGYQFYPPCER